MRETEPEKPESAAMKRFKPAERPRSAVEVHETT